MAFLMFEIFRELFFAIHRTFFWVHLIDGAARIYFSYLCLSRRLGFEPTISVSKAGRTVELIEN